MKLSATVVSTVASQAALNRNPNGKEDIVYSPLQVKSNRRFVTKIAL
jgi:hypothetical protein